MKAVDSIMELIGNTPIVKIGRAGHETKANIFAKLEMFNPLSSVKDRIALSMITAAEASGALQPGGTIIEPTSGNTGIGLSFVSAAKGYHLILTMPETMSVERRKILAALGAELILTPGTKGMAGAISKAEELSKSIRGAVLLQQFKNPANPEIHRNTTAEEIWRDMDGKVDIFISGVGTGGTLTGVGERLQQKNPRIHIVAVEPEASNVLSGGRPGPHKLQGIGAGFVPDILNTDIIDEIVRVREKDAYESTRSLASVYGIFAGISSGAAFYAAKKIAKRSRNAGKNIVIIFPDSGERYLSVDGLF